MGYLPFLATMFFFILFSNITEIIPVIQFPANARIAMPMVLALLVWVIFNVVGVVEAGPCDYITASCSHPGVPKALYILVHADRVRLGVLRPAAVAERPTLRQHARRPPDPGDVRGAVVRRCGRAKVQAIILPFPFLLLIAMTGFEILVGFLQAFIFTILTAVYIGSSMHPEH